MTTLQTVITVTIIALVTMSIRLVPFILFSEKRQLPVWLTKIIEKMPPFVMFFLVLYCLRNTDFSNPVSWISALSGVVVTAVIQWLSDSSVISIICGTVIYMVLIRVI